MQNSTRWTARLLAGAALAALAGPVLAQEKAPPQPAERQDGAAQDGEAGDIVVTAQRTAQRLEQVPAAVVAIGAEQIQSSGITKIMDLAQLTPGLQMQKFGYTTQIAIRGITSLTSGIGFENNVATYIDGIYQPDMLAINGDLVNISQVEILKGPQGTLYGRNATGGAVLIHTSQPSDTWGGRVSASYARYNEHQFQGYVTGPLAEGVAFSLAGSYRRSDGYINDLGTDGLGTGGFKSARQVNDSVRARLSFTPAPAVKVTLGYNYARILDAIGLNFTYYQYPSATLQASPPRASAPDTVTTNVVPDNTTTLHEGTVATDIDTGIGKLSLHTSLAERKSRIYLDSDGTKLDGFRQLIPGTQRTFQQAADLTIDTIPDVELLVGAHYLEDKVEFTGQQAFISGALATTDYTTLRARAISGYVDGTWHMGALSLTAGLRYSHEHKSVSYYQIAASPVAPGANAADFSAFTPRAVARLEVAPRTNIYASFSQGFRSGVFQNQPLPDPRLVLPIAPEKITAYEVGFKTAGRGFHFDMAGFYYDYSQLQVGVTIPNPLLNGAGNITTIINANKAEVYGLDAQLTWKPVDDLEIIGGLAWLHGRYTDFKNATGTGLNALSGRNISNQAQDWTGQQTARTPDFSATLQVAYTFDAFGGRLKLAGNGNATSSFVVTNPALYGPLAGSLANKQRYRQDAYAIVNLQARWSDPSDHFSATLFVTNLTNVRYTIVNSGNSTGDYRQFSQPRSLGVRLGYEF